MTMKYHTTLTIEKWNGLAWEKRLLNVGSELMRVKSGFEKKDFARVKNAIERAFELIDLTLESRIENGSPYFRKEMLRFRETLAEVYSNIAQSTEKFKCLFKVYFDLDSRIHNLGLQI